MARLLAALLIIRISSLFGQAEPEFVRIEPNDTINGAFVPVPGKPYVFIASKFGSDELQRTATLDSVKGFLVEEIVLVYSQFKKVENFQQSKLNQARWSNLYQAYPELFQSGTSRYRNVCQSGVLNDSVARQLTHGFYIYFKNPAEDSTRAREIEELSKMMLALGIDTTEADEVLSPESESLETLAPGAERPRSKFRKPMRARDPKACRQAYYETGVEDLNRYFMEKIVLTKRQIRKNKKLNAEVRLRIDFNGLIRSAHIMSTDDQLITQIKKAIAEMSLWHPAVRNGVTIKSDVRFMLRYSGDGKMVLNGGLIVPRFLADCGTATDEDLFDFEAKEPKEKTVSAVFEVPDKHIVKEVVERQPQIDSMLLVVDLTGSMGPYIAQVMDLMAELLTKNDPYVACISLFNDGDGKADKRKIIGSTGGITVLDGEITLERLGKAVLKSIKRGNGGDVMENNLEAVKKGLDQCPQCREVVMIADNFATPRDGVLLKDINKPIHWIICGVFEEINTNYLDLVRQNQGYLHTGKSDIFSLHTLAEGETVTIDGYRYQLNRGKFRLVREGD